MNNFEKAKKIKAIAFDIDGVLTDGCLIPLADGDVLRVVDAKDAFAVRAAKAKGIITAIISGGDTKALHLRCLSMGIAEEDIHLGCRGKLKVMDELCRLHGISPDELAYFGDDIPDTQILRACGLGIAPADAVEEAKAAADMVCTHPGGHGAVREGVEFILKSQDKWYFDPDKYDRIF